MKLSELIRRFRTLANDKVPNPYFWSDAELVDWFNDAQAQAAIRGRLLVADSDPALCQIALTPGQAVYPLHPTIYEIISTRIHSAYCQRSIALKTREWLDAEMTDWRTYPRPACYSVQDDTMIRLVGEIQESEVLHLEAYRLPLVRLELPDPAAPVDMEPEIHQAHHEHLIQWVLHKAFSIPDTESFDANRSAIAEKAFTDYFGLMPNSDLRRKTRQDVNHHVRGYLL